MGSKWNLTPEFRACKFGTLPSGLRPHFTRHLVCLRFYWANLPRGKEHEQDSRSYARCSTLPYRDQKDKTTTPGTTFPTLYDKCAGSFTSHRIMNIEGLCDGTSSLWSLSEKTRESNHCRCNLRQHFLLSYLMSVECWSGRS